SLAVNHVVVPRRNLDGNDVPRKLGGESQFSRSSNGAVFRHENRSAAGHALDDSEETAATAELRVRRHLNGTAHPGEFSSLGDDGLVGVEDKFQNRHRRAGDAALHVMSPFRRRVYMEEVGTQFSVLRTDLINGFWVGH